MAKIGGRKLGAISYLFVGVFLDFEPLLFGASNSTDNLFGKNWSEKYLYSEGFPKQVILAQNLPPSNKKQCIYLYHYQKRCKSCKISPSRLATFEDVVFSPNSQEISNRTHCFQTPKKTWVCNSSIAFYWKGSVKNRSHLIFDGKLPKRWTFEYAFWGFLLPIPSSQVSSFAGGQVHWTTVGEPNNFVVCFCFWFGGDMRHGNGNVVVSLPLMSKIYNIYIVHHIIFHLFQRRLTLIYLKWRYSKTFFLYQEASIL